MQENDTPRSMKDPGVRAHRRSTLNEIHMLPLNDFVRTLRNRSKFEVPDFDPADGGVGASLLFLFEKPGPMASSSGVGHRKGSGFMSRDNDDLTAEFTLQFMNLAEIPRKATVIWNAIPRWNGTRNIVAGEFTEGMDDFLELLQLLPNLRGIVLVGKRTLRAKYRLRDIEIPVFQSYHPSLLVKNSHPQNWLSIAAAWSSAAKSVGII